MCYWDVCNICSLVSTNEAEAIAPCVHVSPRDFEPPSTKTDGGTEVSSAPTHFVKTGRWLEEKNTVCNLWLPPPQGKNHNYCETKREFPQECSIVLTTTWGKSFHRHLPFRLPVWGFSSLKSSWCSCKPACACVTLGAITVRWKTPVVIYHSI